MRVDVGDQRMNGKHAQNEANGRCRLNRIRLTEPKCVHTKKPIRSNKRRCCIVTGSLYMVFYAICCMAVCRLSVVVAYARGYRISMKTQLLCLCVCAPTA